MKRLRWNKKLLWLGALGIMLYLLMEFTPIHQYVDAVKQGGGAASAVTGGFGASEGAEDGLLQRIREEAASLYEAPVNAKVDRVWKAIPGYNGIEVDVERTFERNKNIGQHERLTFVFREIEPEIQLEDLGAHPIYKGNPNKKMAGFMINVAWGNEYLPGILATLQEEKVPATFFFDGSWLSQNIETAKEICNAGHECSNHAYSHPNMSGLSRSRAEEEITKTERLLTEELGVTNKWFAPPSGDYDQETVNIAYELGLRTVLWTVDTVDWKRPDPDWIVRRISANVEPGSLILMHPTSSSSGALQGMIEVIRGKGYAFGTVSEVLSSERITDIEAGLDF